MAERMVTPKGELAWVFITGTGKKDLNDNDRFVASVKYKVDSAEHKKVEAILSEFWEENKPKGRKQKSNGLRLEEKDGKETGYVLLSFWTGLTFPDGKAKVIKTYNAKGAEVALGNKKIGNGSIGSISGAMAIYDSGPAACGITLYLNAIQLTKFVEFKQDAGFEATEDGWTGEDLNENGFEAVTTDNAAPVVNL